MLQIVQTNSQRFRFVQMFLFCILLEQSEKYTIYQKTVIQDRVKDQLTRILPLLKI